MVKKKLKLRALSKENLYERIVSQIQNLIKRFFTPNAQFITDDVNKNYKFCKLVFIDTNFIEITHQKTFKTQMI